MGHRTLFATALSLLLAACQNLGPATGDTLPVQFMHVDGAELAYVEAGRGETVVVVHGAVGDWRTYEGLRPLLAARYHYVAYSRRYHHPNAWADDGSRYQFDQHVEDLATFIRGLNVGPVHLVGNSYAGRMVGVFALKHPQLLRSVVLGDPGLVAPASAEGKAAVQAIRQDVAQATAAALAGNDRQAAILVWDAVNKPHTFDRGPADLQQRWLDNARTVRPMLTGAPAGPLSCEQLGATRVPALVLSGELSRDGYRFGNEALLKCLPAGTPHVAIANAHHKWNEENPVAAAQAILAFISKH